MKTFTQSCDKPYDRHQYQVTLPTGKQVTFDDFEVMRAYWFQQFSNIKGCIVDVIDVPTKPRPTGFK